jgi:hypothetical protein
MFFLKIVENPWPGKGSIGKGGTGRVEGPYTYIARRGMVGEGIL